MLGSILRLWSAAFQAQRADPETTSKKHKQTGRGSEREQKADNEADTEREQRADTAGPGPSSQAALNGSSHRPPSGIIGRTVFVRGLGSDVSKQQLQARMESFGAVKACRYSFASAMHHIEPAPTWDA